MLTNNIFQKMAADRLKNENQNAAKIVFNVFKNFIHECDLQSFLDDPYFYYMDNCEDYIFENTEYRKSLEDTFLEAIKSENLNSYIEDANADQVLADAFEIKNLSDFKAFQYAIAKKHLIFYLDKCINLIAKYTPYNNCMDNFESLELYKDALRVDTKYKKEPMEFINIEKIAEKLFFDNLLKNTMYAKSMRMCFNSYMFGYLLFDFVKTIAPDLKFEDGDEIGTFLYNNDIDLEELVSVKEFIDVLREYQ